jgi:pilus biogenesis lipoprotein CpaD
MKTIPLFVVAALVLAGCADPVAEQAIADARYTPERADSMTAFDFAPGSVQLDPSQESRVRALVTEHSQRDEFVVVTDGSGGAMQQRRAAHIASQLSQAGAHWVSASVESSMARGPDQVVVLRSAYRIAARNCPTYTPSTMWNPNESDMAGFGCADAYNMGQMLARPRDAAVGRSPGPADGQVNADAVQRYREGRVRGGAGAGTGAAAGGAGGGATGGAGGPSTPGT